jgi:hypothetical protein
LTFDEPDAKGIFAQVEPIPSFIHAYREVDVFPSVTSIKELVLELQVLVHNCDVQAPYNILNSGFPIHAPALHGFEIHTEVSELSTAIVTFVPDELGQEVTLKSKVQ